MNGWCEVFGVLKGMHFGKYFGVRRRTWWSSSLRWVDYLHVMSLSLVFSKKLEFHCLERFWCLSLKVVSHGDFAGSLPWRWKHCNKPLWGSWNESTGLCLIQFTARGVEISWLVSKNAWGLERSQFRCKTQGSWKESICDILPYTLLHRVLKGVKSDVKHNGLEMSQFLMSLHRRRCIGSWKESISM